MDSNQALVACRERLINGDKNIALSNVGHVASQQKYLLTILLYLNSDPSYKNKKIGLVSFDLQVGLYKNYFNDYFPRDERSLVISNRMNSHFIDWNLMIQKNIPTEFIEEYDLLLWDLPDLNFINSNSAALERFFKVFDSMLIVSLRPSGINDREYFKRIHNFYSNHGLRLPNSITGSDASSTKVPGKTRMTDAIRRIMGV